MSDSMVFVYFLCFAAVAGATFAYMYSMMNATLLDFNRSRERANVHPELSETKDGDELMVVKFKPSFDSCYNYEKLKDEGLVEEESTEDPIVLIHTTHDDGC